MKILTSGLGILLLCSIAMTHYAYADDKSYYVSEKAGDLYLKAGGNETQLTHSGLYKSPVFHPSGDWIYYIKDTGAIDDGEVHPPIGYKGGYSLKDEIWRMDTTGKNKSFVYKSSDSSEPNQTWYSLSSIDNLQFSPDGNKLYFETNKWATSNAIMVMESDGSNAKMLGPGNNLRIIRSNGNDYKYKGYLVVDQHRYFIFGGSYDWYWLFDPNFKEIGPVGESIPKGLVFFNQTAWNPNVNIKTNKVNKKVHQSFGDKNIPLNAIQNKSDPPTKIAAKASVQDTALLFDPKLNTNTKRATTLIEPLPGILILIILLMAVSKMGADSMNSKLHLTHPNAKPFKWGYFNCLMGFLTPIFCIPIALATKDDTLLMAGVLFIPISVFCLFAINRNRWVWVIMILLQFNPVLWIINGIYLKTRWTEMRDGIPAKIKINPERMRLNKSQNYLPTNEPQKVSEKAPAKGQVNQTTQLEKEISAIMTLTSMKLLLQSSLIRNQNNALPRKAKDNWSLGYVAGFVDSAVQQSAIPYDEQVSSIIKHVFNKVYGVEQGVDLFDKFFVLQIKRDTDTRNGMQVGGADFLDSLSDDRGPLKWSRYIHKLT